MSINPLKMIMQLIYCKCMLSRAVGREFGVSKNAAVTVVRLPKAIRTAADPVEGYLAFRHETVVHALAEILIDVDQKHLEYKSVVSFSLGYEPGLKKFPELGDFEYPLYAAIEALIKKKVIFVSASGNEGTLDRGGDPTGPVSKNPRSSRQEAVVNCSADLESGCKANPRCSICLEWEIANYQCWCG
jgi:hypothetical protein